MANYKKMAEEDPSKYPSRMGQKWNDEEVSKLLISIHKKKPIDEIASEHQRTVGGINAERRKLAADYWFNDKRTIEDICKFTGLSTTEVEDIIQRRNEHGSASEKVVKSKKNTQNDILGMLSDTNDIGSDNTDVILLLKDIQTKITILLERLNRH
jgi:hypothetical protein